MSRLYNTFKNLILKGGAQKTTGEAKDFVGIAKNLKKKRDAQDNIIKTRDEIFRDYNITDKQQKIELRKKADQPKINKKISKIYANKQRTKMAMSDAQLMHAQKMAQGEEAYQGKLLESRQSDWKDEAVLIILSLPVLVLAWAVVSDDPTAMDKVKLFFEMFSQLPAWFTNLWILVVASIYGIKGTQIFRNGGGKK